MRSARQASNSRSRPLKRQFEQTLNAHFLRESGLGEADENPTAVRLAGFLRRAPDFIARLEQRPSRPTEQGEALLEILQDLRVPSRKLSAGSAGTRSYWPETGKTR